MLLRHDDPNNPRLIAYWVRSGFPATGCISQLRAAAQLPRRAPARLHGAGGLRELEALPLTANGKLDRKALPAPSFSGDLQQRVAPSTDLERRAPCHLGEVLGHSDFGITDNFFAIGGHSLAAARLVSRIEQSHGLCSPLAALFQNPTIAGLALPVL